MRFENGSQLGPYTIVGPLGVGGMGEVYRATDSKLGREVAIKVLPESMACDRERVARFEREAKVLASLSHSMIAAIYGADEADGKRFLVLELVEGPTLADRLAGGRLSVEESLDVVCQIAEALEVAHEKGIIHRDLKPANIKVTADGQVKVLDFGLAKALIDQDVGSDPVDSPTITNDFTGPGVILGTAAYMSPEQARGVPADERSDIWSLGVVLYECLTGDSIFRGETATDSIGAILHKQPDWNRLPDDTPPTVQLLLRRCLAKDRKRRLRAIGDARIELEAAIADPTSSSLGLARLAGVRKTHLWSPQGIAVIVGAMGLAALITFGSVWFAWPRSNVAETHQPPLQRFTVTLPQRDSARRRITYNTLDVTANGELLAYLARNETGGLDLLVRASDQSMPRIITSTSNDAGLGLRFPTFSPQGQEIIYYDRNRRNLRKVSVLGGEPRTIFKNTHPFRGLTWTSDRLIYFTEDRTPNAIMCIDENGADRATVLRLPSAEKKWPRYVHALPGGRAILYAAFTEQFAKGSSSIEVYDLDRKETRELVSDASYPLYAQSGHLLFLRGSALMAITFDAHSLTVSGQPKRVLEGIGYSGQGAAGVAITERGTVYYGQEDAVRDRLPPKSIYHRTLNADGDSKVFSKETGQFDNLSISRDGKYLAIEVVEEDGSHVSILDINRDVSTVLTHEPGRQVRPVFSPVGRWVYYSAYDDKGKWQGILRRQRDGSGEAELVHVGRRECIITSISSDGSRLYVCAGEKDLLHRAEFTDLGIIQLGIENAQATLEPWYPLPENQFDAAVSPDDRWVAFASLHEGQSAQIYVVPSHGQRAPYKVSGRGGFNPFWSQDGQTLYYATQQGLMAADVLSNANPSPGDSNPSFETGKAQNVTDSWPGWSIRMMQDGNSILAIADAPTDEEEEIVEEPVDDPAVIHVIRNFFTELERVAPNKNESARQ